jgi:RNA-directed DNA polymerase
MNGNRKVRGLLVQTSRDQPNISTPDLVNWQAINWRHVTKRVNQMRQRIYRASKEGNLVKVNNLQRLMLSSSANKLWSIRQVTQNNQGRYSPGIDGKMYINNEQRSGLYTQLLSYAPKEVSPVKRVYIPKTNGKQRPLGLPTMTS